LISERAIRIPPPQFGRLKLGPGRNALIPKGEACDFGVTGEITNSSQCLESVAAANGAFYSEREKH